VARSGWRRFSRERVRCRAVARAWWLEAHLVRNRADRVDRDNGATSESRHPQHAKWDAAAALCERLRAESTTEPPAQVPDPVPPAASK